MAGYEVGMKQARQITPMLRGVPDFSNISQFNQYETGYHYVIVCAIPTFLSVMRDQKLSDGTTVETLINNFVNAIEQETKGISGFEDTQSESMDITDGITTINAIQKVTIQGGGSFSMTFTEKSGTPIVKLCDYYLRGLKDPRTQAKTYNGALDMGRITIPGFEKEVFTFMYINTDNTCKKIEKAYLLTNVQLTKAETTIYETTKGDISNKEITLEFNAFPIDGTQVNELAKDMLIYLYERTDEAKLVLNSNDYNYFMVDTVKNDIGPGGYNKDDKAITTVYERMDIEKE